MLNYKFKVGMSVRNTPQGLTRYQNTKKNPQLPLNVIGKVFDISTGLGSNNGFDWVMVEWYEDGKRHQNGYSSEILIPAIAEKLKLI